MRGWPGCRRRRCGRAIPTGGAGARRRASGRGWTGCRRRSGCGRRPGRAGRRGRAASRWRRRRHGPRRRRRRSCDGRGACEVQFGVGERGGAAGEVVGDAGGVPADAVDEVRVAVVLEALAEDVEAGHGVTPRRWRISPEASSTGRCSHGYARRWPVAHSTLVIPRSCRSSRGAIDRVIVRRGFGGREPRQSGRLASTWASISASTRRIRASAAATLRVRSSAKPARGRRCQPSRPVSSTPAARRARDPGCDGPAGRRAAATVRDGPRRVRHVVDGPVEAADPLQPPEDVHAAVAARQPAVAADRQHDVTSGAGEFVGELHAAGRCADDEHAAARQRGRVAVGRRRELDEGRIELAGHAGHGGRSHHPVAITTLPARQCPLRGDDGEAVVDAGEVARRRCPRHGSRRSVGVVLEVGDDLGADMKPWRSAPVYDQPGSRVIQFGVSRRSESQRSLRQRSATRPRSSTTWSTPGR